MIDSFKLFLSQDSTKEVELVSEIPPRFDSVSFHSKENRIWYTGRLRNLTWSVSDQGLWIGGSMTKFKFGNNYTNMKVDDISDIASQLFDAFGVDLKIARITKIDFGITVECSTQPLKYFRFLGTSPYYKSRSINNTSLTYSNKSRSKTFYDKLQELRDTQMNVPIHLVGKKLIRYEVRYRRKPSKHFNRPEILLEDLASDSFNNELSDKLWTEFSSIHRIKRASLRTDILCTEAQFRDQLAALTIHDRGFDSIIDMLSDCELMSAQNKTRARTKCRELLERFQVDAKHDLYDELAFEIRSTLLSLNPTLTPIDIKD